MARYFFHLLDGFLLPDTVGEEFETLVQAQQHSITLATQAVLKREARFWRGEDLRMAVTDVGGEAIFELRYSGRVFEPEKETI